MTNALQDQRKQLRNEMRQRRKQQLRDGILDAAQTLLEQKGFAAIVMDDLAALAGISKPTLYSHFATKDELLAATVAREINRQIKLTEGDAGTATPLAQLTRFLETIIQLQLREQRDSVRMWMPEIHRLRCEHTELMVAMARLDARLNELVREAVTIGEIDPALDPATVVRSFFALTTSIRFMLPNTIEESTHRAVAYTLTTIFKHGVSTRGGKE